ncbi:MAG TPA: ribonuclease E/G [Bacillus bacterium]|nr:ribonuclease E/G [Bacillus sp. (in: firmicutes)]
MRKIILNYRTTEKRAAVLENDTLMELFIEGADEESIVGNIYKGRVEKVVPGMQAAFVNIGQERNGFLQIEQLVAYKNLEPARKVNASISNLLHEGQELVVQVTKDGFGEKGPRLTTMLELSGLFVIYLTNDAQISVSKKIAENEREKWRRFGQSICTENEGVIFRTACAGKEPSVIGDEMAFLKKTWQDVLANQPSKKAPCLLYNNSSFAERLLWDMVGDVPTEIVVDDGLVFRTLKQRLSIYDDGALTEVRLYTNKENIFSYFGIEQEMDKLIRPYVELENGASLMIEETEALTVVDVNTGKFTGKYNANETIVKTNEIAASEIARQLRLRNIGGMILIDFINMEHEKDREFVKNKLVAALKTDRNYTKVFRFTQLGLLEMTRKKQRKSLLEKVTIPCPTCCETGRVYSSEQVAFRVERALWEFKGMDHEAIWLEVPENVSALLKANNHLTELEAALRFKIFITTTEKYVDTFKVRQISSENEIRKRLFN